MLTSLKKGGYTVVETIIIIVVIGILATIVTAGYIGFSKRSAKASMEHTLKQAAKSIESEAARSRSMPTSFPDSFSADDGDITLKFTETGGAKYGPLTPVQNGVLFHSICKELIADSQFSTIHAREGGGTSSVMMSCDDNIQAGGLLITGWSSKNWPVPVRQSDIEAYMASIPYDNWWTDKQAVQRSFHQALIDRHTARGGDWPVLSFWDPWANKWSGVKKEELPDTMMETEKGYCVEAIHNKYPDMKYIVTSANDTPRPGGC